MPAEVDGWIETGRRAWPDLRVPDERLRAFFAARVIDGAAEVPAGDLYLACACAEGLPEALAAFAATFDPHVRAILGRMDLPEAIREEARGRLAGHLFLAEPGGEPRIARYLGRGALLAFVRVTAVRLALGLARKEQGASQDELDDDFPAAENDPELIFLKEVYRHEFKTAFAEAVVALEPRARTLLRYHLVDGLSIDRIGALYGIHRSTAARQLADARQTLAATTQRTLMGRLRVDRSEVDSILRLVMSQLDVSVRRLLT